MKYINQLSTLLISIMTAGLWGQEFSAHFDGVVPWVDFLSDPGRCPIDRHLSKLDQFLRLATRADSSDGKEFVDANPFQPLHRWFTAMVVIDLHLRVDMPGEILQKSIFIDSKSIL